MKKKHLFAGLAVLAAALLAAGCANNKLAEPAKSSHAGQTAAKKKKTKSVKKARPVQKDNQQSTSDQSSSTDQVPTGQTSTTDQTQSTNEPAHQASVPISDSVVINDVISRMGYPSNYDASDFSIMRNGDRIDVAENHTSAHMKAAGAYPGVSPVIAHYQVIDGHLYYLNPADNSRQAVN